MGHLLSDEAELVRLLMETVGDFLVVGMGRAGAGDHDNIVAPLVGVLGEPVGFPDAAADAVSYHGMADFCAGGDTEAVVGKAVSPAIDNNTAPGGRLAPLVQTSEQMILFKRLGKDHGRIPSRIELVGGNKRMGRTDCSIHPKFLYFKRCRDGRSVAESVSALAAATGKDLAAVSGGHSLSEAMNFLSVELLGLIGTLRHSYTPPEKLCSTAKTLQRVKLGRPVDRHQLLYCISRGKVNLFRENKMKNCYFFISSASIKWSSDVCWAVIRSCFAI